MIKFMLAFLVCLAGSSCFAQQAIQKAVCGQTRPTAAPCSFAQPVTAGDLLVAVVEVGDGGALPVTDSLGQTWKLALSIYNNGGTDFYYVLNTIGTPGNAGNETVFFPFDPSVMGNCYAPGQCQLGRAWSVVLLEYPPAVSLDVVNQNPDNNPNQNTPIGYPPGASDWNWSYALETTGFGDLIIATAIGFGTIGCKSEPGYDYAMEANVGAIAVEDMIATRPSMYFPTLRWTNCTPCWGMGAIAFKMK